MTSDEELRRRILDAAEGCLLEAGFTARLHAAIAERAGVSRPTVYKHVGDQDAIVAALLSREVERFLAATESVLTRRGPLRERFVETVAFVVEYGRQHVLLQKGLRDEPEAVLPWFTSKAGPLIEQAVEFFAPHLREMPPPATRVVVEWAYRIIASLITTPSTLRVDDPRHLRAFVSALLDLGLDGEGHRAAAEALEDLAVQGAVGADQAAAVEAGHP